MTSSAPAPVAPLTDLEIGGLGSTGAFVRDGFLGRALANAVRAEALEWVTSGRLRPAGIRRGADHRHEPTVRNDRIAWIDDPGEGLWREAWQAFEALRGAVNEACWLGLRRFELQLAYYPGDGARYVRHRDAFPGDDNRRLTAIVYLNPDWRPEDGGRLRLHHAHGAEDLAPELDRLVVFLSERVEHEVLPTFAPRFALTAWYSR